MRWTMENNLWREALKDNLIRLRREKKLTQAEVGEKLNYSDKTISKWERGDGVPDLSALMDLSALYGVTLDNLVGKPETKKEKGIFNTATRTVVLLTITCIVWISAIVVFMLLLLLLPEFDGNYLSFVFALPVTFAILGAAFSSWHLPYWAIGCFSLTVWGICLVLHLTWFPERANLIYSAGGIVQLAIIIAVGFVLIKRRVKNHDNMTE